MNKITFSNLPSTSTPVNATNLNQLQTNVDNAKVEKTTTLSTPDDLNNYKTTGTWIAGGAIGNVPVSGQVWYVEVIRYSGNYVLQRATRESSTLNSMSIYIRQFTGGNTWSDWKDISAPIVYSLSSYLSNDWVTNGKCEVIKFPNCVALTVSVKDGTDRTVMTLPSELRPDGLAYGIAGNTGSTAGALEISSGGVVKVGSNLQTAGKACFSITYSI